MFKLLVALFIIKLYARNDIFKIDLVLSSPNFIPSSLSQKTCRKVLRSFLIFLFQPHMYVDK